MANKFDLIWFIIRGYFPICNWLVGVAVLVPRTIRSKVPKLPVFLPCRKSQRVPQTAGRGDSEYGKTTRARVCATGWQTTWQREFTKWTTNEELARQIVIAGDVSLTASCPAKYSSSSSSSAVAASTRRAQVYWHCNFHVFVTTDKNAAVIIVNLQIVAGPRIQSGPQIQAGWSAMHYIVKIK